MCSARHTNTPVSMPVYWRSTFVLLSMFARRTQSAATHYTHTHTHTWPRTIEVAHRRRTKRLELVYFIYKFYVSQANAVRTLPASDHFGFRLKSSIRSVSLGRSAAIAAKRAIDFVSGWCSRRRSCHRVHLHVHTLSLPESCADRDRLPSHSTRRHIHFTFVSLSHRQFTTDIRFKPERSTLGYGTNILARSSRHTLRFIDCLKLNLS